MGFQPTSTGILRRCASYFTFLFSK